MHGCDVRNFLAPCLLLLLAEQPDHGYDLVARARPFVAIEGDAGAVYRALRHLEEQGLARSHWLPPQGGPSRRSYQITDAGRAALRAWVDDLTALRATVDRFLRRYGEVATRSGEAATRSGEVATRSGEVATRSGDAATARYGETATARYGDAAGVVAR